MRILLTAILTLLPLGVFALDVPYLGGRVNDLAGMIDDGTEAQIETALEQLENDTGSQLVVLTIPTLEDAVLEDYAIEVASTWKLGRKDVDDGVLVLVAKEERKIRIEVGYGLEGLMTDAKSGYIIRKFIIPEFKKGNFAKCSLFLTQRSNS